MRIGPWDDSSEEVITTVYELVNGKCRVSRDPTDVDKEGSHGLSSGSSLPGSSRSVPNLSEGPDSFVVDGRVRKNFN